MDKLHLLEADYYVPIGVMVYFETVVYLAPTC
jgi:hypothetical protein